MPNSTQSPSSPLRFINNKYVIPFGSTSGGDPERGEESTFIGREGERAFLIGALTSGKAHGAYLITGRRGAGKTSFVEACLKEYRNSVFLRFLRANHGRGFWDLLLMASFSLVAIFVLLMASTLLGITAIAWRDNPLLLLLIPPLAMVCLIPVMFAGLTLRGVLRLFCPNAPWAGIVAVGILISFALLTFYFGPVGSPAVAVSRFLVALAFLVWLGRVQPLGWFQHTRPLSKLAWGMHTLIALLIPLLCVWPGMDQISVINIFDGGSNDDGQKIVINNLFFAGLWFAGGLIGTNKNLLLQGKLQEEQWKNGLHSRRFWSRWALLFVIGSTSIIVVFPYLTETAWKRLLLMSLVVLVASGLISLTFAWVFGLLKQRLSQKLPSPVLKIFYIILTIFSIFLTVVVSLEYLLEEYSKGENAVWGLIHPVLLLLIVSSAIIGDVLRTGKCFLSISSQSQPPSDKNPSRYTPPFEALLILKALLLTTLSIQLLYPLVNLHPQTFAHYAKTVTTQTAVIQSPIPWGRCVTETGVTPCAPDHSANPPLSVSLPEYLSSSLPTISQSQLPSSASGAEVDQDASIHYFNLFRTTREETVWLFLTFLAFLLIFAIEYDWINRGLSTKRHSSVMGRTSHGGHYVHSHHDPFWWEEVEAKFNVKNPSDLNCEQKRWLKYAKEKRHANPKNDPLPHTHRDRLETFLNIERVTLPWAMLTIWMPTIVVRVNLGFDVLNHRGVTHAMLHGLRSAYQRCFFSVTSGYALISNLGQILLLLFTVAWIGDLMMDFPQATQDREKDNRFAIQRAPVSAGVSSKNSDQQPLSYCTYLNSHSSENKPAYWPRALCAAIPKTAGVIIPLLFAEILPIRVPETILDNQSHLTWNVVHVNNGLPQWKNDNGVQTIPSLSFRIYHLLLFLALLALLRWFTTRFPLLPYRHIVRRIDTLIENLHTRRTERRTRPLWRPLRTLRSGFADQVDRQIEEDKQDPRSIEMALLEVLEDLRKDTVTLPLIGDGPTLPVPEVTFVFDELDKITGVIHSDAEDSQQDKQALDAEVRRAYALHQLLSDMKRVISSAPARFIFVGNRLLHDEWMADQSRRQPLLTSIFDQEIYLPSLLLDRSTVRSSEDEDQSACEKLPRPSHFSDRIYEYLIRRYQQAENAWSRLNTAHAVPFLALRRSRHADTIYSMDAIDDYEKRLEKLKIWVDGSEYLPDKNNLNDHRWHQAFLSAFVRFLTYRSVGNPKKLQELFARFVRPADRLRGANDSASLDCEDVLFFKDEFLFRIQVIDFIYTHLVECFETALTDRDDKVLTTLFYLFDFLLKFHGRAFSWSSLERIDELAQIHRMPDLRALLEQLIDSSAERLLHPLLNGMYAFRFRSSFARELDYLSRASQEEAAAFNFTLDEAQGLKAAYIAALKTEDDDDPDKVAGLGELYEYDQQYEEARNQYRKALQLLDENLFHRVGDQVGIHDVINERGEIEAQKNNFFGRDTRKAAAALIAPRAHPVATLKAIISHDTEGMRNAIYYIPWGIHRLRLMLQIGMTFELTRDWERAKLHYMDARLLAWALIELLPLMSAAKIKDDELFRGAANDLLKHANLLYQPLFAEAWVSEKLVGGVDTASSLVETDLLRLRRILPFLSEMDATENKKLPRFLNQDGSIKRIGSSNFALIGAELHDKAGDLYFYKGKQFVPCDQLASFLKQEFHQSTNGATSSDKSNADGLLFRAHYHYAVALHELRRFIVYRRYTSAAKFNAGHWRRGSMLQKQYTIREKEWPTFVSQSIYNNMSDLSDVMFARVPLFSVWQELVKDQNNIGAIICKASNIEEHINVLQDAVDQWFEYSDTEMNPVSKEVSLDGKKQTFEKMLKVFLGIWWGRKSNIQANPYPILLRFDTPDAATGSWLSKRLLAALFLQLASTRFVERAGYSQDAARECLLLLERIAQILQSLRIIIWMEHRKPKSKIVSNLLTEGYKTSYQVADKNSQCNKFIRYLAALALSVLQRYDQLCRKVWRRRPSKSGGGYLIGTTITPEVVTAVISIMLSLEAFPAVDVKKQSESLFDILKQWLGKSAEAAQRFQHTSAMDSASAHNVLIYLLTRHRFPALNQLNALKVLVDNEVLSLSHEPTGQEKRIKQVIYWLEELRIINERYDAPLHFTHYRFGESAALVTLSGLAKKYDSLEDERICRRALEKLQQARGAYTMGRQYYESTASLHYLYDDFNSRHIHAAHANQMAGMEIASILEALVEQAKR